MFCPQCGTESSANLQFCRSCGANLKMIGKAVTLSESIARSDRGPLPKIKEMMKSIKIEHATEEITRALDKMNKEIVSSARSHARHGSWWLAAQKERTAERRRERQIVRGTVSLFSGAGLTIFLYYLSSVLVLKLPPDVIAKIPFELDPVVHVIWLLGLIPMLSGMGRIIAGLTIKPGPVRQVEFAQPQAIEEPLVDDQYADNPKPATPSQTPASITEHTTNILEHKLPERQTNEIKG